MKKAIVKKKRTRLLYAHVYASNFQLKRKRTSKTLPSNPITLNKTEHALSVARKALLEIEEILK